MSVGLARWANRLGVFVQGAMTCMAWFAGIVLCTLALGDAGSVLFLPFMLTLSLWLVTLLVHEGGHYVAARHAGMTVLRVRVGRVELQPQQRGWRVRWALPQKIHAAGYVTAVHDPSRPLRGQSLRMIAGGPGANLLVAIILGPVAWWCLPHAAAWLTLAFALLNALTGLANLVPGSRGLASDGLQLLLWRNRQLEFGPLFAHARLLALTVAGVTADRLPEDQLALLDAQPAPMPMVALWYRLKARQNRGEWEAAAAQQTRFEHLQAELTPALRSGLAEFLACIRTELAFSLAMRDRDAAGLMDNLLPEKSRWSAPALWPRCLALRALLEGHLAEGRRLLGEAQCVAEQSLDRALPLSEALIQRRMLALAAESGTHTVRVA